MTSAHWCFTINNPEGIIDLDLGPSVRYLVYQLEVGENGTEHFQGYIEFVRSIRLNAVKKILREPTAHLERRRGTRQEARAYCMKNDSRLDGPWEYGTWRETGQGTRSDIHDFKKRIDEGATDLQLWDEMPECYVRYEKLFNKIRLLKSPRRTWKTYVTVCYGTPRSGKTYWCYQQAPNASVKSANNKWFVDCTDDVIFDEFKAWLPWATLLQCMDAYPCIVEGKGFMLNFNAKRLYITTNWLPCDWYTDEKHPLDALTLRVNSWKVFGGQFDIISQTWITPQTINTYDNYESFIRAVVNYQPPSH